MDSYFKQGKITTFIVCLFLSFFAVSRISQYWHTCSFSSFRIMDIVGPFLVRVYVFLGILLVLFRYYFCTEGDFISRVFCETMVLRLKEKQTSYNHPSQPARFIRPHLKLNSTTIPMCLSHVWEFNSHRRRLCIGMIIKVPHSHLLTFQTNSYFKKMFTICTRQ